MKSPMDLEGRKIMFVQEFLRLQNEEIVAGLEKLLRKRKAELVEKGMKPMTIAEFNKAIDQSLDDSKKDKVTKASDLKSKIKKWN